MPAGECFVTARRGLEVVDRTCRLLRLLRHPIPVVNPDSGLDTLPEQTRSYYSFWATGITSLEFERDKNFRETSASEIPAR